MNFPANAFARFDETPDENFYAAPRLVTHIDDAAINAVTQLYRDFFPPNGAILDLMSSWISHLPPEVEYRRVVGLGMNQAELRANPRLNEFVVQNLNETPQLPFEDATFDAAAICVSVQYLKNPLEVFREIARVLAPAAPLVVTFSNRCFPTKAVGIWSAQDDAGHAQLVKSYFENADAFSDVRVLAPPLPRDGDPLFAVVGFAKK